MKWSRIGALVAVAAVIAGQAAGEERRLSQRVPTNPQQQRGATAPRITSATIVSPSEAEAVVVPVRVTVQAPPEVEARRYTLEAAYWDDGRGTWLYPGLVGGEFAGDRTATTEISADVLKRLSPTATRWRLRARATDPPGPWGEWREFTLRPAPPAAPSTARASPEPGRGEAKPDAPPAVSQPAPEAERTQPGAPVDPQRKTTPAPQATRAPDGAARPTSAEEPAARDTAAAGPTARAPEDAPGMRQTPSPRPDQTPGTVGKGETVPSVSQPKATPVPAPSAPGGAQAGSGPPLIAKPDPGGMRQVPGARESQPPAGGSVQVQVVNPELMTRAVCLASPETCCPKGQTATDGCRMVTEALLDIRIRSYVPPRFTVMGRHYPWDTDFHLANLVSDVSVSGPYKVWPGCRFNVTEANHAIEDSKSILQKAGELFEAWLAQWSGGVESAKNWVSQGVASEVCEIVDDSQSCRDTLAPIVKTGINVAIASLGMPPEIPDVQQLREHGIRYIAAQAASYAFGDPAILDKLPLDEETRILLYNQLYDVGLEVLTKELNKVIPSSSFDSENPATWGHLEPAYAPHNAHLYVEVRVKPGAYPKYMHLLAVKPTHKWQPLYLHDLNQIYASVGPIAVPTFIPQQGVILPIELEPHDTADTKEDTAETQIPGIKISRAWLKGKFGITAADGLVKAQRNWLPRIHATYSYSDWDLFYEAYGKSSFRLLMPVGKGVMDFEENWTAIVGTVRDADIGADSTLVLTSSNQLQNYYGRIDPAPRCDGKANLVAGK